MYDIGYALGRQWAKRDATLTQMNRVNEIVDGRTWVALHKDPVEFLKQQIDPEDRGFLDWDESSSSSFIAGFIDGAKSI